MSCESSSWQTIRMKYQDLFSMKRNKKKIIKSVIAAVLTVNILHNCIHRKNTKFTYFPKTF